MKAIKTSEIRSVAWPESNPLGPPLTPLTPSIQLTFSFCWPLGQRVGTDSPLSWFWFWLMSGHYRVYNNGQGVCTWVTVRPEHPVLFTTHTTRTLIYVSTQQRGYCNVSASTHNTHHSNTNATKIFRTHKEIF